MWFKSANRKIAYLQDKLDRTDAALKETLHQLSIKQTTLAKGSVIFTQLYYFYHQLYGESGSYGKTVQETYHLTAEDAFNDTRRGNACVSQVNVLKIGDQYFRPLSDELVLINIGEAKNRYIPRY